MKLEEECFDTYPKKNREFVSNVFRYGYSSMITTHSTFEYDLASGMKKLLKVHTHTRTHTHTQVHTYIHTWTHRHTHLRLVSIPRRVPRPTVGQVKHSLFGLHSRKVTGKVKGH